MRLIDADKLLEKECCGRISGDDVRNAPTINLDDLRERGQWIIHSDGTTECSECHTLGSPQWKCCPVCTALMDGKENEDA